MGNNDRFPLAQRVPDYKLSLDDNVDFANINLGKSQGINKRKDSPPSRKIIIATNKNNDNTKKKVPVKPSTNEEINKI